jgi:hypothetical protein
MGLLQLQLVPVPSVVGIYGASKDQFAKRLAFLHPDAAAAYTAAAGPLKLRVSDMFRTAADSLKAMAEKKGVQPPGFSAHNYGLAIDIAVDAVLAATGYNKARLDQEMASFGWYCHRADSRRGFEDWHYNHLGNRDAAAPLLALCGTGSRAPAADARIVALYGDQLRLTPAEMQEALLSLKLYTGKVDGIIGPKSEAALTAFQKAWQLPATGKLDGKTERTLAYVSATQAAPAAVV